MEELRLRHLQEILDRVPGHLARLEWPAERLRIERETRLREMVVTAKHSSGWHARRLARIDPDRLTEETLAELPTMTKDDLMGNFDEIVTDPRVTRELADKHLTDAEDAYLLDEFRVLASGGSSGRRGVFVYGWVPWAEACLTLVRWLIRDRMTSLELAQLLPVRMAGVVAAKASHMTNAIGRTITSPQVDARPIAATLPLQEIVEELNEYQPHHLVGYPSILAPLAVEARSGRLRISPLRVTSSSEPLAADVRSSLEETWDAPVGNIYGITEAGCIGMPCWRGGGMHLPEDLVVVEPVDQRGNPVGANETAAKYYVTNLFNTTMPLIRYEITDEIRLIDGPCPCGSTHRRIADVQGRLDDAFSYPGGVSIHPHLFRSLLVRSAGVREYQVRQERQGATVVVVAEGEVHESDLGGQLEKALAAAGLSKPHVTVRSVSSIERQDSGKLRRFVPLVEG